MFRVDDVYDEARSIIGNCDDVALFRYIGDAVSMIANKAEFEGWKGWIDICTTGDGRCLTLPREVETVLAVNFGGKPTLGYGTFFNFHLNGMGDCRNACDWSWQDQGQWHSTYRDLETPSKLVAYLQTPDDDGKELVVFGYDSNGNPLRREENGAWKNGYRVPTIYGVAVPDSGAPLIARITGVYKANTIGSIRLSTIDNSSTTGVLLGIYEPDEKLPQYRRIRLNRKCSWVRVAYRKTNPTFTSRYDHIPLKSSLALILAVRARKFYKTEKLNEAIAYEANAARLELEAQSAAEPNTTFNPIQVHDGADALLDKDDFEIS